MRSTIRSNIAILFLYLEMSRTIYLSFYDDLDYGPWTTILRLSHRSYSPNIFFLTLLGSPKVLHYVPIIIN